MAKPKYIVSVPAEAEVMAFKPLPLEEIAARNNKTVEEVQRDFAVCSFYGALADKFKISFADAAYWMRRGRT